MTIASLLAGGFNPLQTQAPSLLNTRRQPNLALLNAAAGILGASGPSREPVSFGQIMGRGLQGYAQGKQQEMMNKRQEEQDELNRRLIESKINRTTEGKDIVGSPMKLQNGNLGYLSSSGEVVDTGTPFFNPLKSLAGGGGAQFAFDPLTGEASPVITGQAAGQRAAETAAMTAAAKKDVASQKEAESRLIDLETQEQQLVSIMNDPNFEQAVGPLDAITGRIGERFGTEAGVLGSQLERQANALVREAAGTWKGAISEKELELFQQSVPGRGSSPETWRTWFQNEYMPRKQAVQRKAGQAAPQAINWSDL
jgi:hypothetical protein